MKRLMALALGAVALLASTGVVHGFDSRLPNVNDPSDRKAVIALVRAANATGVDLKSVRLGISSDCGCGGAYQGQWLFIADENFLDIPQWALDAVMAHEMGHALKRHVEMGALRDMGIVGGLAALGALLDNESGAESGAAVGKLVVALTRPKFTQPQEYEADRVGVEILRKMGYKQPGNVMAAMFELFMADARGGGWFDSHPSTPDRVRRVRGR
jgi:Peptidase family M48